MEQQDSESESANHFILQEDPTVINENEEVIDMEISGSKLELAMSNCSFLKRASSSVLNETSQHAIIGVKRSHIESLDYEIAENDVFKDYWRSRTRGEILQYITLKWTMACLVGICTGVVAFVVNVATVNITEIKLLAITTYLNEERYVAAALILGGSNLLLVLLSASLCAYIAPAAAGSGIPEVKAYLNGVDAPNILAPKTLLVKVVGSIGAVAGGLEVGKEGPLVHTGSCIASLFSQGGSKRFQLTWRWLRYLKNDRNRRDLVTCGAAAGVAAAFRAPVGGVLFALEEVASWWRSALLWRAFFTTACVSVVHQVANNYCQNGNCGMFGSGGISLFDMGQVSMEVGLMALIPVIILGIIGGVLGSFFTYLNGKIVKAYSEWHGKHGSLAKLIQAILVSCVSSLFMFGLPWLATCTPCPSTGNKTCPSTSSSGIYKQYACASGHYNDLAGLLLSTKDDVIKSLFNNDSTNEFRYDSLLLFLLSSFVLALVTYGTAVPSGLFIPIIIIGALYGRLTGKLMRSLNGFKNLDEALFAYLGAASFLGGSMRMTVSLCVILLELTNSLLMLPLTMLVLLISKTIGDLFNLSVYDQIIHIKGLPFLEEKPQPYMKHLTVLEVCSCPPVTLSVVERVGNIMEALRMTDHNGFPVLETTSSSKYPTLYGLILRSHLLVLLQGREFFSPDASNSINHGNKFCSADFAKPGSGNGTKIEDVELSAQEEDMFLDLHAYANTSPYTVAENISLAKAFSLFRQLGLRHLCVVPKTAGPSPTTGILTRHDFMPEHVLALYPHLKSSKWRRLRIRPSFITKAARRYHSEWCF